MPTTLASTNSAIITHKTVLKDSPERMFLEHMAIKANDIEWRKKSKLIILNH